jgi:hypothetical protein
MSHIELIPRKELIQPITEEWVQALTPHVDNALLTIISNPWGSPEESRFLTDGGKDTRLAPVAAVLRKDHWTVADLSQVNTSDRDLLFGLATHSAYEQLNSHAIELSHARWENPKNEVETDVLRGEEHFLILSTAGPLQIYFAKALRDRLGIIQRQIHELLSPAR